MQKTNKISSINSKTNLDMLIKSTTGLISLPEIYLKIRGLMNDQTSVLDDFAIVVNGDANLAARVLKIVNSSFYGFPGQISSIARALNFIGITQLHDLVLSVSTIKAIKLPSEVIDLHKFWQRSIYCGVFAKCFAKKLKIRDRESFFVIGLLHEIGRLALALNYPDEFQQARQQSTQNNLPLYKVEMDDFGFHYGHVGQALMKEWKLPTNFQEITGHHPDLLSAQQFITETAIIHLAHLYAYAEETEQQSEQISLLVNPSVWKILDMPAEKIQDIVTETRQLSKEMEQLILN
jgi:HD-like signal output (HDOD) protein